MNFKQFNTDKNSSLSHQVIKLGRLLNEEGLRNVRKLYGIEELKQAHLDLFPHIDFEGTSISEIAKKKGVSKQAVSKMVAELEIMRVLELKPDPKDARSKKVFFKTKGPLSIQKGLNELLKIDKLLRKNLGERDYTKTLKNLSALIELLDK